MTAKCTLLFIFVLSCTPVAQSAAQTSSLTISKSDAAYFDDSLCIIKHRFGRYFLNGKKLSTRQVMDRLSCTDSVAFGRYVRNHRLQKSGLVPIFAGLTVSTVGFFMLVDGFFESFSYAGDVKNKFDTGAIFIWIGDGLVITGIGFMIGGKLGKNRAVRRYNGSFSKTNTTFYIRPAATGMTVGLRF